MPLQKEHQIKASPAPTIPTLRKVGAGITAGYHNQPELTADRFLTIPALDTGRLYKTGDLVSWTADGQLLFHGRIDEQIQLRGFRVELPGIESVLNQLPTIRESKVIVKRGAAGAQLVACVLVNAPLNRQEVNHALAEVLPAYMVPNHYQVFDEFPLTSTGKVDTKQLRASLDLNEPSGKPATATEAQLESIFQNVLECETVSFEDGFFAQGGDSLSLVYLVTLLEDTFGIELPISEVRAHSDIRSLARFIDGYSQGNGRAKVELEYELGVLEQELMQQSKKQVALLTGATGFVGAFLLKEMLETHRKVYCLVRGANERDAWQKLHNAMNKYDLVQQIDWSRLEVVLGDLEDAHLTQGAEWDEMAQEVEQVIHCGAHVNFLAGMEELKNANVKATMALLAWCKIGKPKTFNFISTRGVYTQTHQPYDEYTALEDQVHFKDQGYAASKWLADIITQKARTSGIAVNVFRLGRITGESVEGVARFEDFFHRVILGSISINCFPKELASISLDLTPVDICAQAIVQLAGESTTGNYHIINPDEITYGQMVQALNERGASIEWANYEDWLNRVMLNNSLNPSNTMMPITPLLKNKTWLMKKRAKMKCEETIRHMAEHGLSWPGAMSLVAIYQKQFLKKSLTEAPVATK